MTEFKLALILAALMPLMVQSAESSWLVLAPTHEAGGKFLNYRVELSPLKIGREVMSATLVFDPLDLQGNNLLGSGWSCPLADSNLVEINESKCLWNSPEGGRLMLQLGSNGAKGIQMELQSDGKVLVSSPDGYKYYYLRGLLTRVQTPEGLDLIYKRKPNATTISVQNVEIFTIEKIDGENGRIKSADSSYLFKLARRPVVRTISGLGLISDMLPTVSNLSTKLTSLSFDWGLDQANNAACHVSSSAPWGKNWTISTSPAGMNGEGMPDLKSASYTATDNTESVITSTGYQITRVFLTNGSLGGKIRKLTVKAPSGEVKETNYYYDVNGNILRKSYKSILDQ